MMTSPIKKTPACIAIAVVTSLSAGHILSMLPGVWDSLYGITEWDFFAPLFDALARFSYDSRWNAVSAVLNVVGFFVSLLIANLCWTAVSRYRRSRQRRPRKKSWIKSTLICFSLALLMFLPVTRWIVSLLDLTGWFRSDASYAFFTMLNGAFDAHGCEDSDDVFAATMLIFGFIVSLLTVIAMRSYVARWREKNGA
ncbi:hypothetical protein LJ656_11150 [Paraburkholderia sp. MMS20-SJTR3]|uniref:Uncharacterized protein n=1 Tax=Paraburkholderia sejongensis TaxID=2886946 RepID=A0ABS8JTW6_9BURK|nr:hypothetical protein [Paraburkholderia sp. MMS20-SJTR3]MCC8393148.1 hypothetical protein [Paraburkholderia sp. MMS20-SJTR3]